MKKKFPLFIMAFALVGAGACSGAGRTSAPAFASSGKRGTPEESFEHADKLLRKKYYEQAIDAFERLRNTFPFSKFAVEAELRVADALFAKGDYAEAADAYRTFGRLHPKHEKIDYASYRVGWSLFKDAPRSVDRDQTSTELAMEEFRQFLARFPESDYADKAADFVAQGRARLAAKELYIGRFYFKEKAYKASIPRFQRVVDRYPETDSAQAALFLKGKAEYVTGAKDAAQKTLEEYIERYPKSENAREAKRMIRASGGPSDTAAK